MSESVLHTATSALAPISIFNNVSLADKNWFATGGNAAFYCQPSSAVQFVQAIDYAKKQKLQIFMLGQGANVLISDEGFDGLVIRPVADKIIVQYFDNQIALVTAGSGVIFHDLITFCLNNKLLGLEEFSGIPGTVGGCVYINLHYYEFLLEQFLVSAQIIDTNNGEILTVDRSWFQFGYDQSKLQEKNFFLISATFQVKIGSDLQVAYAQGRHQEIIRHRQRRYPTKNTCGSFFRNFLPEEVINTEKKLIYVAYYLDKLGVKGELSFGDAIVSYQHANMIVNRGKAMSADIIMLAATMQKMVFEQFGIKPQPECQLIGFKNNPL